MQESYDAIVVGSGAGGGMAAWMLTRAGARVLMLEAGRDYDPNEAPMLSPSRDAPLRGVGTPDKDFGYYLAAVDGGWDIPGEPYTKAEGTDFLWWRNRMLGGRTNHWGRNSFRMGPYDFKPFSRDGLGVDWPVSYEEMAPWYDRTETVVGVYGDNPGLENHPDSGPGVLHDPPKPRAWELFLKSGGAKVGMPVIPARRAVLTRQVDDRQPCYWASDCGRGCAIGAAFQTTTSLIPYARATGKLTVQTDAMVYEVMVDRTGKASGVRYIDRKTRAQREAKARVVILSASTGETARILLNTKVSGRSEGLANSSGQVGRNLMDTVGSNLSASFPALEGRPRYNEDGAMGLHVYVPFWQYQEQKAGKLNFARGYHIELYGGFGEPGMTSLDGYGPSLRRDAWRQYGTGIGFALRGEMIPNAQSWCEIDPVAKDKFGIPVLKFHFGQTDQERNMVQHFRQAVGDLVTAMGGRLHDAGPIDRSMAKGGEIIHEVGTARMGSDRRTSVTDSYGRCWDVDNLYLADGSVFASKAHKNPTLTIMALAMRTADHVATRLRQGEL
ncbi:GMC family oxidoreductase [Sphingomonas sp. BGYR3]|uniref:GMC family oxidoreductase n=1 Tax=Sphingomonas sp. BGYR3 TaxID=2975483 RepID=UPI0021A49663|nr:GMC family oxidoreductase [Sphingomonas sp. BGYR3]MDG5488067.1 GMC family oxidoreductase [Sphingomonas sp. BGYR3]